MVHSLSSFSPAVRFPEQPPRGPDVLAAASLQEMGQADIIANYIWRLGSGGPRGIELVERLATVL